MKRKAADPRPPTKSKRPREQLPDYCDVEPRRDGSGAIVWPAPEEAIEGAREFMREWYVRRGSGILERNHLGML